MAVVQWRPRQVPTQPSPKTPFAPIPGLTVGSYAGRACFRPSQRAALTPALQRAVGQVVEVGFAGVASYDEPFAGQSLYLEWRSNEILDGFLIPEQDLEFLAEDRTPTEVVHPVPVWRSRVINFVRP